MSEEEKKAIENLKHIVKHWKPDNEEDELANIEYNSIKIAVNLIENSISKDKIREHKQKFEKDSKTEKVFMTQSSQINASLISFCDELLERK